MIVYRRTSGASVLPVMSDERFLCSLLFWFRRQWVEYVCRRLCLNDTERKRKQAFSCKGLLVTVFPTYCVGQLLVWCGKISICLL